ncbi:hypothetical protein D3C73_1113040 [compost metagenome]
MVANSPQNKPFALVPVVCQPALDFLPGLAHQRIIATLYFVSRDLRMVEAFPDKITLGQSLHFIRAHEDIGVVSSKLQNLNKPLCMTKRIKINRCSRLRIKFIPKISFAQ